MNCKKCGAPLNDGDVFCQNCGAKVEEMQNHNHEHHNAKQHMNENNERNNEPMNNNGQEFNNGSMNNGPMYNNQPMNNGPMNNGPMYANQPMNNGPMYNNPPMNNGPMYNNQPMNNGPMYGNPNGYYQQPKTGGMGIFAVIGVILLIGIGVLVYFLLKPGSDVNPPVVSKNDSYTANFKGYTFRIPNDYISEVKAEVLAFGDKGNTWAGGVELISGTYGNAKTKMDEIRSNMQSMSYVVNDASIKTISNKEVIAFDVTYAGSRKIIAYAKLDSSHVFGFSAVSVNNTADYNVLGKVVAVGFTATPSSANSIAVDDGVNISALFEPAQ